MHNRTKETVTKEQILVDAAVLDHADLCITHLSKTSSFVAYHAA
jgi:hypothetical protein